MRVISYDLRFGAGPAVSEMSMARYTARQTRTLKESFNCRSIAFFLGSRVLTGGRKFPGSLRVKFYWRPHDYRTKVLCEWYDNRKFPQSSCFPLSDLHVKRNGPLLYLCCPTVRGASTCWISLNFTSYECKFDFEVLFVTLPTWLTDAGLVIFHCTVLSLRAHDTTTRMNSIDHNLDGESCKFAG